MSDTEHLLRNDEDVQNMVSLYAALNDWYDNIHQERRGVRACERLTRIQDDGLIPTAQRYFEYIATENGHEFTGDASHYLDLWADEFRPDYVARAGTHDWDGYERSVTRGLLDAESRIGRIAHDFAIDVNNATINITDTEILPEHLQQEFQSLWRDWFHRLDDLYWARHNRLYKQLVHEIEDGHVETEDKTWGRKLERYPELPSGTYVGGEQIH